MRISFPFLILLVVSAGCKKASGPTNMSPTPTNVTPVISSVSASTTTGLQGATTFSFSAQATDADGDVLTYSWDFGDQGSATGASPAHVYQTTGTFTVKVAVSDGKSLANGQTTVTVKGLSGTWFFDAATSNGTIRYTLAITHSGSTLNAPFTAGGLGSPPARTHTYTGSVGGTSPQLRMSSEPRDCGVLGSLTNTMVGDPNADISSFTVRECTCNTSCATGGTSLGPFVRQ